jgi:hypothetical protein
MTARRDAGDAALALLLFAAAWAGRLVSYRLSGRRVKASAKGFTGSPFGILAA